MSSEKSCFTQFVSILLIILFIPTSILSVSMVTADLILLNPDTWKNVLFQQDAYDRIPALAAEQILYSSENCPVNSCQTNRIDELAYAMNIPAAYLINLDQADWETIFSILMPVDWLQIQTEVATEQIFTGLNSGTNPVKAYISLEDIGNRLTDEDYKTISQMVLEKAPVCNADELLTMAAIFMGISSENMPFCVPTEEYRPMLETTVDTTIRIIVQSLPAQITLDSSKLTDPPRVPGQPANMPAENVIQKFNLLRTAILFSPLIPLLLLILLGAIAIRSWHDAGRWLGIPLIVSGILLMIVVAMFLFSSSWIVTGVVLPRMTAPLCPGINQLIQDVVHSIVLRYSFWNGAIAGLIFLVGAILLLIPVFHKPKNSL